MGARVADFTDLMIISAASGRNVSIVRQAVDLRLQPVFLALFLRQGPCAGEPDPPHHHGQQVPGNPLGLLCDADIIRLASRLVRPAAIPLPISLQLFLVLPQQGCGVLCRRRLSRGSGPSFAGGIAFFLFQLALDRKAFQAHLSPDGGIGIEQVPPDGADSDENDEAGKNRAQFNAFQDVALHLQDAGSKVVHLVLDRLILSALRLSGRGVQPILRFVLDVLDGLVHGFPLLLPGVRFRRLLLRCGVNIPDVPIRLVRLVDDGLVQLIIRQPAAWFQGPQACQGDLLHLSGAGRYRKGLGAGSAHNPDGAGSRDPADPEGVCPLRRCDRKRAVPAPAQLYRAP